MEEAAEKEGKIILSKDTVFLIVIAFAALVVGGLIGSNFFPRTTGVVTLPSDGGDTGTNVMGNSELGQKVENYINEGPFLEEGITAIVSSVEDFSDSLYVIWVNLMEGETFLQEAEVYATKDGKSIIFGQVFDLDTPLAEPEPEPELQKSDKPDVELFVMSHCPYGTQMEKGILPVVELLGDKIDFKVRFVYYSMHGETEVNEQARQYCIQKEQNSKFIDYLSCFLEDGDSERCLVEAGIDTEMLNSCIAAADAEFNITANLEDTSSWLSESFPLFDIDKELNEQYGIGGSPTLVINGTTVSSGRDPASLLATICSAFNEEPAECGTSLSSETPTSGFGYEGTGSTNSGTCG